MSSLMLRESSSMQACTSSSTTVVGDESFIFFCKFIGISNLSQGTKLACSDSQLLPISVQTISMDIVDKRRGTGIAVGALQRHVHGFRRQVYHKRWNLVYHCMLLTRWSLTPTHKHKFAYYNRHPEVPKIFSQIDPAKKSGVTQFVPLD